MKELKIGLAVCSHSQKCVPTAYIHVGSTWLEWSSETLKGWRIHTMCKWGERAAERHSRVLTFTELCSHCRRRQYFNIKSPQKIFIDFCHESHIIALNVNAYTFLLANGCSLPSLVRYIQLLRLFVTLFSIIWQASWHSCNFLFIICRSVRSLWLSALHLQFVNGAPCACNEQETCRRKKTQTWVTKK